MGLAQATRGYLESGGMPSPSISLTTTPNPNTIILTWNQIVSLTTFGSLATSYVIVPPVGHSPITVIGVLLLDPTHLQLTTTDQENGESYQLNVSQGVVENGGSKVNFATAVFFTGNNVPLTVSSYNLINSTNLTITYSRVVDFSTAIIPGNYVFVPSLVVNSVERVTDNIYRIHTVRMQPNTTYDLTISGVRALDGSLI